MIGWRSMKRKKRSWLKYNTRVPRNGVFFWWFLVDMDTRKNILMSYEINFPDVWFFFHHVAALCLILLCRSMMRRSTRNWALWCETENLKKCVSLWIYDRGERSRRKWTEESARREIFSGWWIVWIIGIFSFLSTTFN